ncbi:MAG: putative porin [Verrucomicrobiales bacterium]|jgi:hypothetical protein|nr:putative porin [Verrucomicrobiales bacterium]
MNKLIKTGLLLAVALPFTVSGLRAGAAAPVEKSAAKTEKVADNNALIQALVKKGVLTNDEAQNIQADLDKQAQATPGGFLKLGSPADKGLRLYGDARLRYEYLHDQRGNTSRERERYRYRLRVGAEYKFTDDFSSGVRFRSGESRRTGNSDFGTGDASYSANDKLNVDLVYLSWDKAFSADWLALSAGRIVQPHHFNGYAWAGDLTVDGGAIKLGNWKITDDFTIGSTHGAYVWTDREDNPFAGGGINDVFLFINQVDLSFKFNKDWKLRFSPSFVNAIGDSKYASDSEPDNAKRKITYLNDISKLDVFVLDAVLDTPFFINGTKGKLFGEYGVNISDSARARELGTNNKDGGQNQFFLAGYEVSKGKGKGSWSVELSYAYFEALSWSAQFVDTSFNGGVLNGHGPGVKVGYGISDNVSVSALYRKSWHIDSDLGGAGSGSTGVNTLYGGNQNGTDVVQIDLTWKF